MLNSNLSTALADLKAAIRDHATLGSIESAVIHAAGVALITEWNDHAEGEISDGGMGLLSEDETSEALRIWQEQHEWGFPEVAQVKVAGEVAGDL